MKKNKKIFIICFAFLLVFMGVGYSVLSTKLTINSTSTLTGKWQIEMTSIEVVSVTGGTNSNSVSLNSDKLGATFDVDFNLPGDSITYKIVVENKGNIDSQISCILPDVDDYYVFTSTLEDKTLLKANSSYMFQITVSFDINATSTPSASKIFEINISAIQDNGSGKSGTNIKKLINTSSLDDIGTEVLIGDEHFYVISSTDNTVTLLSKYNLLVGSLNEGNGSGYYNIKTFTNDDPGYNLQYESDSLYISNDSQFISTFFSNDCYWEKSSGELLKKYGDSFPTYVYDSNSNIYNYLENYKTLLQNNNVTIDEIRLISYEELIGLGCTESSCSNAPNWVYSTKYWTGTAKHTSFYSFFNIYYVDISNVISTRSNFPTYNCEPGVRPVITISKSLFN